MKTIASRTLAASPGKVWADLEREGAIVITKDGVPRSIMVPTSDATILEDVQCNSYSCELGRQFERFGLVLQTQGRTH